MELSDPDNSASNATLRRKSGRVVKKPEVFTPPPPAGGAKRKRVANDDEDEEMIDASEDDVESDEGEPDEEEMREKKRKARKAAARKPAAKKPKANGEVNLAIRPAANAKAKRPRKARPQKRVGRVGVDAEEVGGLYRKMHNYKEEGLMLI